MNTLFNTANRRIVIMAKNTANRPSQSHQEYVLNSKGQKVRNLAYKGSKNKNKDNSINDFSNDFVNESTNNSDIAPYSDKELKEMYQDELELVWNGDQRMINHCLKKSTGYIMVKGKIIPFEKPSVKTEFYYPEHGYDYDEVQNTISDLSEDEQYFIQQNIRESDVYRLIEQLKSAKSDDNQHYVTVREQYEDSDIGYIKYNTPSTLYRGDDQYDPTTDKKLDDETIDALIEKGEKELEKFDKRLKTYLKRYGLSKVRHSSYWADR